MIPANASPRRRPRRPEARRAFTLLEIIVVVTIIALLAAIVAPRMLGNVEKAKVKAAETEVRKLYEQVSLWMLENNHGSLPDDFELKMLAEGADRVIDSDDLNDPWDNPYVLRNPGQENPDFDIVSYGADAQPGGEGTNADITN
jgi:general secretion pathway protein G